VSFKFAISAFCPRKGNTIGGKVNRFHAEAEQEHPDAMSAKRELNPENPESNTKAQRHEGNPE
jgi:hypothetical protein